MESGLRTNIRVVTWVVATSIVSDAVLITVGAGGIGALLSRIPLIRMILLAAGVVFLGYLGGKTLLSHKDYKTQALHEVAPSSRRAVRQAMAMSLLNPHAVLDTVGIIGAAAAAQQSAGRLFFAGGAVTASIIWFTVIGFGTAALRHRFTSGMRQFINRASGFVLLGFGVIFLVEFIHMLNTWR